MVEVGDRSRMPKKMRYKLVSNGERLKIFSDEDVGGSYLTPSKIIEEVLRGRRLEGYADFVEDRENWKSSHGVARKSESGC